jgi:flagellar protein FlaI
VGHGGLCTIHAENVEAVEKRLLTKPMDVPPLLLPLMNVVAVVSRIKLRDRVVRRVLDVSEIESTDEDTGRVIFRKMYEWDHDNDSFISNVRSASGSYILRKITELRHVPYETLLKELDKREQILKWMLVRDIKDYDNVSKIIREYYSAPDEVYNRARLAM